MQRYDGQFEHTYEIDLDKSEIIRTRIYDFNSKQITPDNTVYQIEKDLLSTPGKHNRYVLPPVLRAVGKPDADTIEILVIGQSEIITTRSTSNDIITARGKRLT